MDLQHRDWWDDAAPNVGRQAWLHVWAPPHGGKTVFLDWLQKHLGKQQTAHVLRLAVDGETLSLKDHAGAVHHEGDLAAVSDIWTALNAMARMGDGQFYVLLDDIDPWLLSDPRFTRLVAGFRAAWNDLDHRLHLVTTAAYSVQALGGFVAPNSPRMPPGFLEVIAPGFPYPGEDGANGELRHLVDRLNPMKFGDFRDSLVVEAVERCDGHPGLVLEMLGAIDAAEVPASKKTFVRNAADAGVARLKQFEATLVETLFPWSDADPFSVLHGRITAEALRYFLFGAQGLDGPPDCAASFCRSLGLVTSEILEIDNHAPEAGRGSRLRAPYLGWVPLGEEDRLKERLRVLLGETLPAMRLAESRSQQREDPTIAHVRALAEVYFCDTERGKARQTAIEGTCKPIIEGQCYSLTLASHQDRVVAEAARDKTTITGEKVVRDSLRVFLGIPEKLRDAWQREFAILRKISDTGSDALPDIRESGTLTDIVKEGDPFGFILIENEGFEIRESTREYFREPENRNRAVQEVRRLIQALVDLQKLGIVHRLINRNALRWDEVGGHKQLRLAGFELATNAYAHESLRDSETMKQISAEHLSDLVGIRRNRIFCEPSAQFLFFADAGAADDPDEEKTSHMPQSDVYGLCMTLCDLFYGAPREEDIKAFEAADTGHDAAVALETLIANHIADIKTRPTDTISATLRDLLLSGLEPRTGDRPTAIDLMSAIIRKGDTLYVEYSATVNTTYLVTYNATNMLTEMARNLRYMLGFDPESDTALTDLQTFLEVQLRSATHIFRDPSGFGRFVSDPSRRTPKQDLATLVISCAQGLNFYCDLAGQHYGLPESNGQLLVLRYTLDRRNHALAGLVDDKASMDFPDTAFRLVPSSAAAIVDNQPESLARDERTIGNWKQLVRDLKNPNIPPTLQAAYDALQFVTDIEYQERELMHFPVLVEKSIDSDHYCRITLDTEHFNRQSLRDPYQHLLLQDARMQPEVYFQVKLLDWLERSATGPEDRITFRKAGTDVNVSLPVRPNDVRRGYILIRPNVRDLEGNGSLRFSDDRGVNSLYNARQDALAKLRKTSAILEQLQSPHPTMALSRARPDTFGKKLKGRSPDIIWDMINAHPIFLLQGPPGTGKTRALSESVFHVLSNEEKSAKFLISAQSHASVDTTLQRIAQTFRDELSEDADDQFHIIRYMPTVGTDRVAQSVQDTYALTAVVDRVAGRMRVKANQELDRLAPVTENEPRWQAMRRAALQLLRDAPDEAYDEIERRVQRNASMHFTTTSAVRDDTIGQFGLDGKFHTAVVEEAAKVWGAGIIQPLIMARKAILIGDHKQIGPFDASRFNRLATLACGGDPADGRHSPLSGDADPIFPQYRDNPEAMVGWLETFRRIFERYETGELTQKQHGVRMADTLDTQFRSTEVIGDLVSHTFYEGKVQYGKTEHDLDRRLIDIEALGASGPSLVWLNTQKLNNSHFHVPRGDGRIENAGEARILERLLSRFKRRTLISDDDETEVPINERLLILSPYRSQIERISQTLRDDPTRYGFSMHRDTALAQIATCCTSIDAAQGMEADTVIVSCVRSVSADDRDYPAREDYADAAQWNIAMRRNFGFMTEPERINVMLSRARLQLICIGNFDHFDSISDVVEDWSNAHGRGSSQANAICKQQGFWARLTGYLKERPGTIVDLEHGSGDRLV